jgi:hypothetical protein
MAFKWKQADKSVIKDSTTLSYPNITEDRGCNAFCNVDNPGCTKRGSKNDPIKLCWDNISLLEYSDGLFHIKKEYYNIAICKKCDDYFLIKCNNCTNKTLEIICYLCKE